MHTSVPCHDDRLRRVPFQYLADLIYHALQFGATAWGLRLSCCLTFNGYNTPCLPHSLSAIAIQAMLSRKPSTFNQLHQYTAPSPVDYPLGSDSVVTLPRNYVQVYQKLINGGSQYRNSRTGNRTTRTQIDHDVFEGLPVRHWRKRPISVNAAPEKENIDNADLHNLAWKELPMPRDSHLLSPMSQDLLRAARMPQAKKPTTPLLEDDKEPGEDEDADGEIDTGFVAKRWAVLPKELEAPEPEFLAKRRKGLPSVHSGSLGATSNTSQMRKTKIRKIDTEGNNSVWEVLVPEGQTVEGEVVEEETSPTQAPAPGTVVEGVGVVNAEGVVIAGDQGVPAINKRRPPPPKRKAKGPGRGRKKKVAFVGADGAPTAIGPNGNLDGTLKTEDADSIRAGHGAQVGDTEIGDNSLLKEGDQEGEEGSEEGSEDDEGEEGDREEGELSPSPSASRSPIKHETPAVVEPVTQPPPSFQNNLLPQAEMPLPAVTEYPPHHLNEPVGGSSDEPGSNVSSTIRDETVDDMLDEPMEEMLDEPMHELSDEPLNPSELDTTHLMTTLDIPHAMFEMSAKMETELSTEVPLTTRGGDIAQAPVTTEDPTTETMAESMIEAETGPTTESPMEPPANTSAEPTAVHSMEPAMALTAEPLVGTKEESIAEMQVEAPFEVTQVTKIEPTEDLAHYSEPAAEATIEPTVESSTDSNAEEEPREIAMTMPTLEPVSEPQVLSPAIASPGASIEPAVEPVAEPVAEPLPEIHPDSTPQVEHEPMVEQVNKSVPEPVPERRFSYTRPTSSPNAPTPSPPTPIETTFPGLQAPQAPYLSPKAPTMSPPTPIDRGMSSSPDLPLSSQFQLPPHIDAAHEANQALGPTIQQIPNDLRISVEAAPQVEPKLNAQIPVEHDPLEGMAEPKVVAGSPDQIGPADQSVHFEDGEEDLLGSLERSLGS